MKCKKLVIETNGTPERTKIIVDGKQLGRIQTITLKATMKNLSVKMTQAVTTIFDPTVPKGEIKVRPLILEFEPMRIKKIRKD